MSKKLMITLSILAFIAVVPLLKNTIMGESTRISISDNGNEHRVLARFPREKSKTVHNYLRKQLNLNDLPDLSYLEISDYQTPDRRMNFYIKSRDGYIKIWMDKNKNSAEAYSKIKSAGEGLREILTR